MEARNARNQAQRGEIEVVRIGDDRYPPLLRTIHDPPAQLYVRGTVEALRQTTSLAVVGARKMTPYGGTAVRMLVPAAARAGAVIVSGLALGVDAAAHAACLDCGGTTVAVLAGGVDAPSVGPRTNAALAERIVATGGALVSEHPPGTHPMTFGFPRRNRIVAGLCTATMVVEAAAKSGALITAYQALDDGRDVLAVPGPITSPASAGANGLLRRGAMPITAPADLLETLDLEPLPRNPGRAAIDGDPGAVLAALEDGPCDTDALAEKSQLPVPRLLVALTSLAIDGRVTERAGTWMKN